MTNADIIRNMTDEELADNIEPKFFDCTDVCKDFKSGCSYTCKYNEGKDFILEWLKTEI